MEIANHFFERKQHCCEGSIEGGGHCCGRANRYERFDFFRAEPQRTPQNGGKPCANLNRWTFSPERYAAGERYRRAEKLSENRAKRNSPAPCIESRLRLWDTATSCVWEIFE